MVQHKHMWLRNSASHLMVSCYDDLLTSKRCCLKLLLKPPAASAPRQAKSAGKAVQVVEAPSMSLQLIMCSLLQHKHVCSSRLKCT